jgi:thiosulfate/3-mercaptopyruvate sulfurtransferase
MVLSAAEVESIRQDPAWKLIDARSAVRFRGEQEPIDPVAGHIPGAVSRPLMDNVDAAGRFRTPAELRARLTAPGAVIVHCGSGVTACQTAFAMRLAGLREPRLYEGSWSDWIHTAGRPVATGEA